MNGVGGVRVGVQLGVVRSVGRVGGGARRGRMRSGEEATDDLAGVLRELWDAGDAGLGVGCAGGIRIRVRMAVERSAGGGHDGERSAGSQRRPGVQEVR